MKAAFKVKVGEHEIDTSLIPQITLGDLEALEDFGINTKKLEDMKATQLIKFAHYFLSKVNPSIKEEEVRKVPIRIMRAINEKLNEEPDQDF